MFNVAIIFATVLGCVSGYAVNGTCPPFFEMIGDQCYFFSSILAENAFSWYAARDYCSDLRQDYDVELAVLDLSCTDNVLLLEHLLTYGYNNMWLGGSDITQEGDWQWIDGRPINLGAHHWYPGQPTEASNFNCVQAVLYGPLNFRVYLNDNNCALEFEFVCQTGVGVKESRSYYEAESLEK